MKPGMQRDLVIAFWFLFDEFEIGLEELPPATGVRANPLSQHGGATPEEPPLPPGDRSGGRRTS